MQPNNHILVIGSTNVDMTARVEHMPKPGETVGNATFNQSFGGKGANQAVAASRAGAAVSFIGCVGTDMAGEQMKESLSSEGINIEHILVDHTQSSGTALILVDANGENSIAVAPGANSSITPEVIDEARFAISGAEFILMQMEIPLDTVKYVLDFTSGLSKKVILNAAPAYFLEDRLLRGLYMLVVNRQEAGMMAQYECRTKDDIIQCASILLQKGVQQVVVTLGSDGAYYATKRDQIWTDSYRVKPVDTTAAGDVFCGALAASLLKGTRPATAMKYAAAAAALCVTRKGAQDSVPDEQEINVFLNENEF